MANLLKRKSAHQFQLPTVRYILLFWQEEQKYEMLPSSSPSFRSGTEPTTSGEGSTIILEDDSSAKIIAVGEDPSDVKSYLSNWRKGSRSWILSLLKRRMTKRTSTFRQLADFAAFKPTPPECIALRTVNKLALNSLWTRQSDEFNLGLFGWFRPCSRSLFFKFEPIWLNFCS